MATIGGEMTNVETIRKVILLLNRAIYSCNKLLVRGEESIQVSGQDNEPRRKRPSA